MLKEEVVANHKYFAKIGDEYFRVRTAQKPFAKDGYVKCKKLHSYDKEKIYVSFDNLYTSIPKDKLDVLKKREEEYKGEERKKLEQRQRDKLRAEEERNKQIAIHMEEEEKKFELAIQEIKEKNPDLVWVYPKVDEWKDRVIEFIKNSRINNSVKDIEAIFAFLEEDDDDGYFQEGYELFSYVLGKINKGYYDSLFERVYVLLDSGIQDFVIEKNGLKDIVEDDDNALGCYILERCCEVPEIGLDFENLGFICEVFSMITKEELYDAIMYAKKN